MRSLERRKGKGSRRSLVETQAASEEERKNITTNCSIGSVVAKQGLRRAKDTHEAVDGSSGSDSDTKMIMRGWHKIPATDARRRSGCNSRALFSPEFVSLLSLPANRGDRNDGEREREEMPASLSRSLLSKRSLAAKPDATRAMSASRSQEGFSLLSCRSGERKRGT